MFRSVIHIVWLPALLLITQLSQAQCYNCDVQFPGGTFSTTSNSLTQVTSCAWGGEYSVYNVTAGETYTWTTCGGGAWDTQLTLFTGATCGTGLIEYNDDDCGLQSTITWTATFTGQVNLLISQYNCQWNTNCMAINWACTSCGGGSSGDINACSGNWYDSGGPTGNYPPSQNDITTICPDNINDCVQINFSSFALESGWDYLSVYDGNSTASPLIGTFTGNQLNGTTLQSTHASGCLTFLFESDGSIQYAGWAASISCADCDEPPPAPPEDCNGGITICSDATFDGNSSGPGVQELNASNSGCLADENESTWFFFSPQSTGTIEFMINPNPMVDYDFAIWGPYDDPTCPPPGPPIRCSWSASLVATGLQAGAGDNSEGAWGDGIVNPITVGPAQVGQVYILLIDNWTASTTPYTFNWNLGGGMTLDCTPLPVEMLEFTGARVGSKNILQWKTATELNADYFDLERSSTGSDFESIGQVPAQGISSNEHSYTFEDPEAERTTLYYRLKQVDFNGDFEYFGPIAIDDKEALSSAEAPFPNPMDDGTINVYLQILKKENITSRIFDVAGRMLIETTSEFNRGRKLLQLDLGELAPGSYQLQINDGSGSVIHSSRVVR